MLFVITGITNSKSQDVIEYSIINSNDIPDTLFNYSSTNFTAYDLYTYLELKKQDVFTTLIPHFFDNSLSTYKDSNLVAKHSANSVKEILMTIPDTTRFYDSILRTVLEYTSQPHLVYSAKSIIIKSPVYIGFKTYRDSFIYVRYSDAQRYLSNEHVALLQFLQHKNQSVCTFESTILFAKNEVKILAKKLYLAGVEGKATPYKMFYDTAIYTPAAIAKWVNQVEYVDNPDSLDERGTPLKRIIETPFSSDSLKYLRLFSRWSTAKTFSYNCDIDFIAPTFSPYAAGIRLPNYPTFLLKTEEVLSILTKEEVDFYNYSFRFNLNNRLNVYEEETIIYRREYPPEGYETE